MADSNCAVDDHSLISVFYCMPPIPKPEYAAYNRMLYPIEKYDSFYRACLLLSRLHPIAKYDSAIQQA